MKARFSKAEVYRMLTAVLMLSDSNNNQGLKKIKGDTYDEKVVNIIESSLGEKKPVQIVKKLNSA